MEMDQESSFRLQAQTGLNKRLTGQTHQPFTASVNLRRIPARLTLGSTTNTIYRPHRPDTPSSSSGPHTHHRSRAQSSPEGLAHNKAPGPDTVPAEAWQWLDEHNQSAALRVLNQALLTATISNSGRNLQRRRTIHRPCELPPHLTPEHIIQTFHQDHSHQTPSSPGRQAQGNPIWVQSSTLNIPAYPHYRPPHRTSGGHSTITIHHLARLGESIRQDTPRRPPHSADVLRRPTAPHSPHQNHIHLTTIHSGSSREAKHQRGSQRGHSPRLPTITIPLPHSSWYGDARRGPRTHSPQ